MKRAEKDKAYAGYVVELANEFPVLVHDGDSYIIKRQRAKVLTTIEALANLRSSELHLSPEYLATLESNKVLSPELKEALRKEVIENYLPNKQFMLNADRTIEEYVLVKGVRTDLNVKDITDEEFSLLELFYEKKGNGESCPVINSALEDELAKIKQFKSKRKTSIVSRDIMSQIGRSSNMLEVSGIDEDSKLQIKRLQAEGKLINGTMAGLGDETLLQKYIIALALTLADQSEQYRTEKPLIGLPDSVLEKFPDLQDLQRTETEKGREVPMFLKSGTQKDITYIKPIIIVDYETFTRKVRGLEESDPIGGKDIRETITYLDTLCSKEYIVPNGSSFIGFTFIEKRATIYNKNGNEKAGAYGLSPQFSKQIRSYSRYPSNILQTLKGKQTNCTMNLLRLLMSAKGEETQFVKERSVLMELLFDKMSLKKKPGDCEKKLNDSIGLMIKAGVIKDCPEPKPNEEGRIFYKFIYDYSNYSK